MAPGPVLWVLLVTVPALLGVLGLLVPFTFLVRPNLAAETVRGIKFYFLPLKGLYFRPQWSTAFRPNYVARFVDQYVTHMPAAYALIGVRVTSTAMLEHLHSVKCVFREGYLRSLVREQFNINDINRDGKSDRYMGLAHSDRYVEVGVVPELGMMRDGQMMVERTAFTYELHNAMMLKFAGYFVTIGESLVPDDDDRPIPWLGGRNLREMRTKRAVLDAAFQQIKVD